MHLYSPSSFLLLDDIHSPPPFCNFLTKKVDKKVQYTFKMHEKTLRSKIIYIRNGQKEKKKEEKMS